jgi:hypothetical protein
VASVSGSDYTLKIGKQTVKGTPAASPTYAFRVTGGNVNHIPEIAEQVETDGSIQAGSRSVMSHRVEGDPQFYVRPDEFGLIGYLAMGANADSGATNFTHTQTPAASTPYFTCWKQHGSGALVDRYSDCRVTSLAVSGASGGFLSCTLNLQGLTAAFNQTDPVLAAATTSPLTYPMVTVTKNAVAPGTVDSFDLTFDRGATLIQGDSGTSAVDVVSGRLAVSGSLSILFENDDDYNKFHTGSTGGTSPINTVYAEALNIIAAAGANNSVAFDFANVEFNSYDVGNDPSGAPLRAVIAFSSKRATAIADYAEIIVKNQVATY